MDNQLGPVIFIRSNTTVELYIVREFVVVVIQLEAQAELCGIG